MKTLEAIAKRNSCRGFKADQISKAELEAIIQAGNAAPVGMGKYETLKLSVIQKKALINKIDAAGKEFFAKVGVDAPHPLYGAPTFIIVSGDTSDMEMTKCNASCIIENMIIEATDLGIGSCYIMGNIAAIKDNKEICDAVNVPEGFKPCAGLVLGYPVEEPKARELVTSKIPMDMIK